MDELQAQFAGLSRSSHAEQAAYEWAKGRMTNKGDALASLRDNARHLPAPMNQWFVSLGDESWAFVLDYARQHVNQKYRTDLYAFYEESLKGRYPFQAHSESDVALNDFREFFKVKGRAEKFFEENLQPFINGGPAGYRVRLIEGRGLAINKVMLDQLGRAYQIQQGFFADDADQPKIRFRLEPTMLDPTVSSVDFSLGEQRLVYRHGPILPVRFTWPAEVEGDRSSLVLSPLEGRPIGIEKDTGPWSLFRLLDLMAKEYHTGRDVLLLKADVGGMRANYLLSSQRSPNPFDMQVLRGFRLPEVL